MQKFQLPKYNQTEVAMSMVMLPTIWFGIVCSSWVWMCRASTGQSFINILGGNAHTVAVANAMVSRVILLFRIAVALGHAVFLEQPTTSLMYLHPRFQDMFLGLHLIMMC